VAAPAGWSCYGPSRGADPVAVRRLHRRRVVSNWEESPYDLRRQQLTVASAVHEIVIGDEAAAALRELRLLDPDCERRVFRIRAHPDGAVLSADDEDLDEMIGFVAAEANHEPNRRRQQRLVADFDALSTAAQDS
jgi:hypothetical protein